MKNGYEEPRIELVVIDDADVLTASGCTPGNTSIVCCDTAAGGDTW